MTEFAQKHKEPQIIRQFIHKSVDLGVGFTLKTQLIGTKVKEA